MYSPKPCILCQVYPQQSINLFREAKIDKGGWHLKNNSSVRVQKYMNVQRISRTELERHKQNQNPYSANPKVQNE
jgi:hypothetical protein